MRLLLTSPLFFFGTTTIKQRVSGNANAKGPSRQRSNLHNPHAAQSKCPVGTIKRITIGHKLRDQREKNDRCLTKIKPPASVDDLNWCGRALPVPEVPHASRNRGLINCLIPNLYRFLMDRAKTNGLIQKTMGSRFYDL